MPTVAVAATVATVVTAATRAAVKPAAAVAAALVALAAAVLVLVAVPVARRSPCTTSEQAPCSALPAHRHARLSRPQVATVERSLPQQPVALVEPVATAPSSVAVLVVTMTARRPASERSGRPVRTGQQASCSESGTTERSPTEGTSSRSFLKLFG